MPARIIVIDDTPEIVALYEELLIGEGSEVVAAFAGPPTEADEVAQYDPDIVILDWLFGREPAGMRVLEMLKGYPPTAAIPVIVCTAAKASLAEVEDILTQRGVRVLHKPFAVDDLLAMIREVLTERTSVWL